MDEKETNIGFENAVARRLYRLLLYQLFSADFDSSGNARMPKVEKRAVWSQMVVLRRRVCLPLLCQLERGSFNNNADWREAPALAISLCSGGGYITLISSEEQR